MTRPFTQRCLDHAAELVAAQKAADDLVIAGMQNSIEALAAELQGCRDTLALAQKTVTDLTEKLAAAQTIIDQDGVTIADLTSQLTAAEQTIAEQAARIQELEDELGEQEGKTKFGWFAGPLKFPNASPTETKADMRTRCVAAFGCQPPVERIFNEGTWAVPAGGVPAILSVTQDPTRAANGEFDAQITALCQGDWEGWVTLNHECDQTTRSYTPAAQKAGLAHFSDVVRAAGNPRVKVCMILMSWTLTQGSADHWKDWYPGPDYVDALGWDAYWRPTIPHTVDDIYGKAWAVTQAEGKEFLICETSIGAQGHGGTVPDGQGGYVPVDEAVRTQFVTDAIAYLVGKAAAVTWFETNKTDGNWLLEGHPDALASWRAAVQWSVA